MITLFCVRPKGFNVGNDTIFLGLRHLLREAFGGLVNIVQVPAVSSGEPGGSSGLRAETIHEMNLYGHGVVVGGGNLYENGQLDVDTNALRALRPPLMLFSLSHGRIYDHRHELMLRTDAMPDALAATLNERAAISVARADATLDSLLALGVRRPVLGGCPALLLTQVPMPDISSRPPTGVLLSVRHPRLMSIPVRDQGRLHTTVVDLMATLEADGFGPARILCHDTRDIAFASSLGSVEYILADDIYSHLELLRRASLVVTFRLHAFLPCLSFGTPAINISYDERSLSLVRTIGMDSWNIDFVRSGDVVADVSDQGGRLGGCPSLRPVSEPPVRNHMSMLRGAISTFAGLVTEYAAAGPPH